MLFRRYMRSLAVSILFFALLIVAVLCAFAASKAPFVHAVSAANVVVLSSADPSVAGSSVTFAVAVAPSATSFTYPSGTVTVSVDGTSQGSASLQKGYATVMVSNLAAGSHSVTASYSGDGTYSPATSAALTQVVNASYDKAMPTGIDVTKPPYNLKGDGVTDNTAAFKAMIAASPTDQFGRPGGQRLYFPAGTYLVSDSIDLSKLTEVTLIGDVDQNGNPISTIKANSIATAHVVNAKNDGITSTDTYFNYYPVILKDGCVGGGCGTGPIHMKNLRIEAPMSHDAVGVLIGGTNNSSFENMVFTGYMGITGAASNVYTSAIRDSRFIGPGTPGSIGVGLFLSLIDNSSFSNWDTAVVAGNAGQSVIRSTFTHNGTGLDLGGNVFYGDGLTSTYWHGAASLNDLVFTDNDVAIHSYVSQAPFNNITIIGSSNAPSGQSQAGIEYWVGGNDTWNNVNISGSFSKGSLVMDNMVNRTAFYASHFANSFPGAPILNVNYRQAGSGQVTEICPANSSCAYLYQIRFTPYTYACQAGTIQINKATFHNLTQSADCTPYVALQCSGKASCSVTPTPQSCNATNVGDDTASNNYANLDAYFSCSGTTPNQPPFGSASVYYVDQPLPNYIADVDNVTASHFVSAPQPTQNSHAQFIDVTQHGVVPGASTDQTAAIQALVDSASDGTTFYFPSGWYSVSTLDFSRLKHFTIQGDGKEGGGTAISGSGIAIKVDYGAGAGSFQIRDLSVTGSPTAIYARNAVLSDIQDVAADTGGGSGSSGLQIQLDNPFMVSLRTIHSGGGGDGISINGGMHTTVETQDINGGNNSAYREWGTDHALFASRNEVQQKAGVNVGADANNAPQPSIGFSMAAVEQEADAIGIRVTKCQNCSFSAAGEYGHSLQYVGPGGTDAPDFYGWYIDDAHNTTFASGGTSGYFWTSDLAVTGNASSLLFTQFTGQNGTLGQIMPPNTTPSATWVISPQASQVVVNNTNISTTTSLYPNVIYSINGGISGTVGSPPPPPPSPTPTPTPTPSPTPTSSPTPTPTPTPTSTPTPTPASTPTPAPTSNPIIQTSNGPIKQILGYIKSAVDLNPGQSCTYLFSIAKDIGYCDDYVANKGSYTWNAVDSLPEASATSSTPANPMSKPYAFLRKLYIGYKGDDVTALQFLLKLQGYFNADPTGFFGMVTSGAVAAYQRAHGLDAVGFVGARTLATLNGQTLPADQGSSALPAVSYASPTPSAVPVSSSACYAIPGDSLTYTLRLGMCSTEVITLQEILNKLGYTVATSGNGSPGREVMQFGRATQAAVIKFQKANGITSDAPGVVGPATRKKLISLSSSSNSY